MFIIYLCIAIPLIGNNTNDEKIIVKCQTRYDYVVVNAKINNKYGRFLLDTGASLCALRSNFLDTINTINHITIEDASGILEKRTIISVNKISIGDFHTDSVKTILLDSSDFIFECLQLDGIIGSNLFKDNTVQIDKKNNQIQFIKRITKTYCKKYYATNIEFSDNNIPQLWMQVVGQDSIPLLMTLDTGANIFFDISNDFYKYTQTNNYKIFEPISISKGQNSIGLFGIEKADTSYLLNLPFLRFKSTMFKNIIIKTTNGSSKVGAKILDYGIITIDYQSNKFYFKPYKKTSKANKAVINIHQKKHAQVDLAYKENKVIIGYVWDKKLQKIINSGDEIVSVWGKDIKGLSICDALDIPNNWFVIGNRALIKIRKTDGSFVRLFSKIKEN